MEWGKKRQEIPEPIGEPVGQTIRPGDYEEYIFSRLRGEFIIKWERKERRFLIMRRFIKSTLRDADFCLFFQSRRVAISTDHGS